MARSRRKQKTKPVQKGPLDRERAFELLFRKKTFAAVWRWLERLGIPIRDRRDISQDVFLAAHQSFHTYNPLRARPERWLNKIAVHIAAHYRDRALHRREELTSEDTVEVIDEAPGPDELIRMEEARLLVLELLQELDVDLRAVLIAHDIDGIPMAEIAEQRGIPLSTAYKWRARALALFQELVEERRRKEAEKEGGSAMLLLPLDLGTLLAAARHAPDPLDPPEALQLEVERQVREAIRAVEARGAGVGPAVEGAGWGAPRGGPSSFVGLGAPPVFAPLLALAAAFVLWLGAAWPDRLDPTLAGHAAPTMAVLGAMAGPLSLPLPQPPRPPQAPFAAQAPCALPPCRSPSRGPVLRPAATAQVAPLAARGPAVKARPQRPAGVDVDLAHFEACRELLAHGDATEALVRLDRDEREAPDSRFSRERRILRLRALMMAGDRLRAREHLEALRKDYPTLQLPVEVEALAPRVPPARTPASEAPARLRLWR